MAAAAAHRYDGCVLWDADVRLNLHSRHTRLQVSQNSLFIIGMSGN